jgi:MYXO-CTERM domain-containing protein
VGDGQGPVHTGTGESGSYTFPDTITDSTEYLLSLTATDSGGLSGADQIYVWVHPQPSNSPPVISSVSVGPNPVAVGNPAILACLASDPDNDPLTFGWDFGDGATGEGTPVEHDYQQSGDYLASVEVDDGQGHRVGACEVVIVADGDVTVLQAEDMVLDGYVIEGSYIATYDTGTAFDTFHGPTGIYRAKVVILKETDGRPTLDVYLGGAAVGSIDYAQGTGHCDTEAVDLDVHEIDHGSEIKLVGTSHEGATARVDKLIFQVKDEVDPDGGPDAGHDGGGDEGKDAGQQVDAGQDGGDAGGSDDAGQDAQTDHDPGVDAGQDAGTDDGSDDGIPDDNGPSDDTTGSEDDADTGSPGSDEDDTPQQGCGCYVRPAGSAPGLLALLLAGILARKGRRRRWFS